MSHGWRQELKEDEELTPAGISRESSSRHLQRKISCRKTEEVIEQNIFDLPVTH